VAGPLRAETLSGSTGERDRPEQLQGLLELDDHDQGRRHDDGKSVASVVRESADLAPTRRHARARWHRGAVASTRGNRPVE